MDETWDGAHTFIYNVHFPFVSNTLQLNWQKSSAFDVFVMGVEGPSAYELELLAKNLLKTNRNVRYGAGMEDDEDVPKIGSYFLSNMIFRKTEFGALSSFFVVQRLARSVVETWYVPTKCT